jgi:hypothetical protein
LILPSHNQQWKLITLECINKILKNKPYQEEFFFLGDALHLIKFYNGFKINKI